jgi:hypothetical protein
VTSQVRIHAVWLETTGGTVEYHFSSDLTVLAGPTGVGKTTLLELVKYGFGCNGKLGPKAVEVVHEIILDVTVGASRLRLTRSLDPRKGREVGVTDLITHERLPDHHTDATEPSLSTLLMTALGLPADARAAAAGGVSSKPGSRITFADVYSFMYVPQSEINKDIARSQDSYLGAKRKAVFELLFGITSAEILAMRSEYNRLRGEVERAETEHQNVLAFLRDSRTASRIVAQQNLDLAVAEGFEAAAEQVELREAIDPVSDRETGVLRDLLSEAERSLDQARRTAVDLARQHAECGSDRRSVKGELDRYQRVRDAGERLASIEFSVCPRCMQSLTSRRVPDGSCRVCLQEDPVHDSLEEGELYEVRQLADQLDEMDDQMQVLAGQIAVAAQAIADREDLVKNLAADLDARTRARITPRLQAFSDVVERMAISRARQQELEQVLRQWDRADDIGAVTERYRAERERIRSELAAAEENVNARRAALFASLDDEFQRTVFEMGIPGVTAATIDPRSYLPLLNGGPFHKFSPGGGIITQVQVAYWTSLLTVAIHTTGYVNDYPALLIIDTPQLALNAQVTLTEALYRRLAIQQDVGRSQVQLIIADNEIPAVYEHAFVQKTFSYESPTISTATHPGRARVETIHDN